MDVACVSYMREAYRGVQSVRCRLEAWILLATKSCMCYGYLLSVLSLSRLNADIIRCLNQLGVRGWLLYYHWDQSGTNQAKLYIYIISIGTFQMDSHSMLKIVEVLSLLQVFNNIEDWGIKQSATIRSFNILETNATFTAKSTHGFSSANMAN